MNHGCFRVMAKSEWVGNVRWEGNRGRCDDSNLHEVKKAKLGRLLKWSR